MPKKKGTPKPENAESQAAPEVENFGLPSNWAPIEAPPINPNLPSGAPPTPSGANPYGSGPLPPNFGYQPALVKTSYPPSTGPIDLIPIQGAGVAAANAKAIGVSTTVVNKTIAAIPVPTTTVVTDGLIHGTTPWEIDPSYFAIRDDFSSNTQASLVNGIGETGWAVSSVSIGTNAIFSGALPHIGCYQIAPSTTANGISILTRPEASGALFASQVLWPICDYPGWKCTWVFQIARPLSAASTSVAFNLAHTCCYIGFYCPNDSPTTVPTRPSIFMGLRYDTDVGSNGALTLTQASISTGIVTYTGTITGAGTTILAGNSVTIAGFANAGNNGTFIINSLSGTTIVCTNANGVNEVASATATVPSIKDSTLKFEVVTNPLGASTGTPQRNNLPGTVFDTGVTPTEGTWYRLDMWSTSVGKVSMALNGSTPQVFTVPQVTWGSNTTGSGSVKALNGILEYLPTTGLAFTASGAYSIEQMPFGVGSQVTGSGSGVPSGALGTFTVVPSANTIVLPFLSSMTIGSIDCNIQATGYPAFIPAAIFGNDGGANPSTASKALNIDFFGFCWNPGIQGGTGIVVPTASRYFAGT